MFDKIHFNIDGSVWTSGSNEGSFCDVERTSAWCSTAAIISATDVNNIASYKFPSENVTSDRCLSLNVTSSSIQLTHANCNKSQQFLCEVISWK